jgi:hypothetical protein
LHRFTKLLRRDAQVTGESVRALFEHELADEIGGELTERDRLVVYPCPGVGSRPPQKRSRRDAQELQRAQ